MKLLNCLCSMTNSLLLLAARLPFDQRFYIFFSRFSSYSNQNQPCIKAAQLALLGESCFRYLRNMKYKRFSRCSNQNRVLEFEAFSHAKSLNSSVSVVCLGRPGRLEFCVYPAVVYQLLLFEAKEQGLYFRVRLDICR